MVKFIYAADLKSGDQFQYEDLTLEAIGVSSVSQKCDGCGHQTKPVLNVAVPSGLITVPPRSVVKLVHRPWPSGKSSGDMLATVAAYALRAARILDTSGRQSIVDHLGDTDGPIAELSEAIEAYELGRLRSR